MYLSPSLTGERQRPGTSGLCKPLGRSHPAKDAKEAQLPGDQRWARSRAGCSEHARLPLRVLHSLLEFLDQVLATDFQFAKQNPFAFIGKIHGKDCLGLNAAAGARQIPSVPEALLTPKPTQACCLPSETACRVYNAEISSPGSWLRGLFLNTGAWREGGLSHATSHIPQ